MTPEQLAEELHHLHYVVRHPMTGDDYPVGTKVIRKLLDMAERCADYDRRLTEVMPKDFKDWHQNGKAEWPEVAAWSITNLREREAWAFDQMVRALDQVKRLRERLDQAEEASIDAERVAIERSQDE